MLKANCPLSITVEAESGYLTATITAIVKGHKHSRIDELMPWNYPKRTEVRFRPFFEI